MTSRLNVPAGRLMISCPSICRTSASAATSDNVSLDTLVDVWSLFVGYGQWRCLDQTRFIQLCGAEQPCFSLFVPDDGRDRGI